MADLERLRAHHRVKQEQQTQRFQRQVAKERELLEKLRSKPGDWEQEKRIASRCRCCCSQSVHRDHQRCSGARTHHRIVR
eukprot:m.46633 g.46633  ORF g.46633 m.46633 type:complete len:80 (+) comp14791_c0_seq1:29-268(+)